MKATDNSKDKKKELLKKLHDIQQSLEVPKDNWNDFSKFNYRSAEDILKTVKPLLKKHELVLLLTDQVINAGDRYYVVATASLLDDCSDCSITTQGYAREALDKKGMDDAQITGSASSYARKYALNGLFAIDDGKDPDSTDNRQTSTPKPVSQQTEAQNRQSTSSTASTGKCELCGTMGIYHKKGCPNA